MDTTNNLKFNKPTDADEADISKVSDNFQVLDDALGDTLASLPTTAKTLIPAIKEMDDEIGNLSKKTIYFGDVLLPKLKSGEYTSIGLIGDSITAGVGATGGGADPNGAIIFTDPSTGEVYREGYKTSPCWANKFETYITTNYPSVTFKNRGIPGKSVRWGNDPTIRNLWVQPADVILFMLGTNDRSAYNSGGMAQFKLDLADMLSYVQSKCKLLIVMTAQPSPSDYNDDGTPNPANPYNMNQIDQVITDVCKENNYYHISHYKEFLAFTAFSGTPFILTLEKTGSHPLDWGHYIIWATIQKYFGFIDSSNNYKDVFTSDSIWYVSNNSVTLSTAFTDSLFKKGITITKIQRSDQITITPNKSYGTLYTFKDVESGDWLYAHQLYKSSSSDKFYTRYWDNTNLVWTSWTKLALSKDLDLATVDCGTVTANSFKRVAIPFTTVPSPNRALTLSINSKVPDNVMVFLYFDTVDYKVYARFYNPTASDVVVGSLNFKMIENV